MHRNRLNTALLLAIVALLSILVARSFVDPVPVQAQAKAAQHWYFEPGTTTLRSPDGKRQVTGKVAINLETGDVWGFPTISMQPYPVDMTATVPPVSSPMYLGKFDLSQAGQ